MALSLQRYTRSNLDSPLFRILKERIQNEREKSMVFEIKSKDFFNENLIIEILSWLPVKELLQFKSVCKLWYSIISSPNFISRHLMNYYKNSDSDCLLAQCFLCPDDIVVSELLVDETETPRILAQALLYEMPKYAPFIYGPCDGLYNLCFGYSNPPEYALWNPALNEFKCLPTIITKPDFPSHLTSPCSQVSGFGYDPLTDDYKVVVIKDYDEIYSDDDADDHDVSEILHPPSVFVYSLRTDAWKYCGDLAEDYRLVDSNVCKTYVNGCYYWLVTHRQEIYYCVIICFDMSTDTFEEINLPNFDQPAHKKLGIYDDSLAFLSVNDNEKQFDIWTLNEGLWTKKSTIRLLYDARDLIGYWKMNKFIIRYSDTHLVVCDPKTQETKDLVVPSDPWFSKVFVYKESLVSIKDRNRWARHQETEADVCYV